MTTLNWPVKDSLEVLDYAIDWSSRLGDDTIASSTFSVISGGLVIDSQDNTTTHSLVWLSGGTVGQTAKIACLVVTAEGREFREVIGVPVVNRAA